MNYPYNNVSPVIREYLSAHGVMPADLPLAGIAGSRRAYYRVPVAGFVLLVSPSDDADFGRFLRITQFYRLLRVPVPRVFCIDDDAHQVLLEDLGERRLYDLLLEDRAAGLAAYRFALDILADLQTRCDAFRPECPDVASRALDRTQLQWETSYYRDNYLIGHRGLAPSPELQSTFDLLAARVDAQPKAILHRDYQSQNLMVKDDGTVHVIDYQGSRAGSVFYDAASLLLDPYVMLAGDEIDILLRHLHGKTGGVFSGDAGRSVSFADFRRSFLESGLQRVMQALGAYCFLSRVKGIASFAEHIPAGEARLRWLIRETGGEWQGVLPG
ncbi:MAG TPA: phosphotransferase [Fibrobacteria bacterium]|nr:phosphotransferase [Fibrobacteria bacterium]